MENKVLAKVNGREITSENVSNFITQLGQQRASQFNNEEGRKKILDELINQNLLLLDAEERKLDLSDEFKNELDKMKNAIMIQVNMNDLLKKASVIDSEVEDFYNKNKEYYFQPEQADSHHILVNEEEVCSNIYKEILEDKISFEDAAKKYSSCPSKEKGGHLGTFPKGKMVPEFENALFSMKPGQISKPIKTQFGYHLIRLNNISPKKDYTFEELKPSLVNEVLKQKQKELYDNRIDSLKEKYNIELL